MFRLSSFIFNAFKPKLIQVRFLYGVHHNVKRSIFYVRLTDNERAVLSYKPNGKILNMYSINVPHRHKGQGLARLLAEAAFTYAIVNDYYMYLTCEYLQKYYLATKTIELEERVVGPAHILEGPDSESLNPESVYELPDPEDFIF